MKKLCVLLAALLFLGATFAAAQPVPGKKFELGTSVGLFSYHYESDLWSDSWTVLNVPVRFGWFVWKGLQLEPEVVVTIPFGESKGGEVTYFLTTNLAYNFKTGKKLVPFLGGTAGIGNGIPYMGWVSGGSGEKVTAFGGLAGVKYLIGDVAAIRAEYRLLFYNWKDDVDPMYDETGNIHQFLIGLSIFF